MKAAVLFVVACVVYVQVEASTVRERFDPLKNPTGWCYASVYNIGNLKKGETKRAVNECVNALCTASRDTEYHSCSVVDVPLGCKLSKPDLSKPYPDCCPHGICPKS